MIPTPVKTRVAGVFSQFGDGTQELKDGMGEVVKPRSLNGRKPRISRSKVIAKLASQRAAGTVGGGDGGDSSGVGGGEERRSSGKGGTLGKKRSSLGVKVQRSSFAGGIKGGPGGSEAMMSAKKRARQSEYARRRSKVAPIEFGKKGDAMDVDAD